MVTFVNRRTETELINKAFQALQNENNDDFLRTPIIAFFGVEGIGKTAVLEYIEEQCKQQQIRYIRIDASQDASHFSHELVRQVSERYHISLVEGEDLLQQSLRMTRALLEQGAVVLLLDRVDATNEELVERIASTLREVINENKLFVVLASKRGLMLDSERAVSRKLTSFQLKPLDRKSCEAYFDTIQPPLPPATRNAIFAWTRGYPLAMEIMTTAIVERKLDPTSPDDQQALVDLIVERVIDQKVFASLAASDRHRYKEALTILAVPRHFDLLLMQELIEKFAPELKRENRLAYMRLPGDIKNDTDVLNWHIFRGGFTVDAPVRDIFLLKIRYEPSGRYADLHRFLAQRNETLAHTITTSDRTRYLCEYLYHSAHVEDESAFLQVLTLFLQEIERTFFDSFEDFELFQSYLEDILGDNEFKEAVGQRITTIQSLLYRYLSELSRQKAREIMDEERVYYLRNVFVSLMKDPTIADMRAVWTPLVRAIFAEEAGESAAHLAEELLSSERLKVTLGDQFALLAELVTEIVREG